MRSSHYFRYALTVIVAALTFAVQPLLAQVPSISYASQSQVFTVGTALIPLKPANKGGAVPATQYGQVTTFAGDTAAGYSNATGTAARFNGVEGMTTDAAGNIYVSDQENQLIRKITPAGVVTTFAGKYNQQGFVNGTGTGASFNYPGSIVIDTLGNLYVADYFNYAIRKITPAGIVTTFAGGHQGTADGQGTSASFTNLGNITIDKFGNLFILDYQYNGNTSNNVVRKITPGGLVSTYLGLNRYEQNFYPGGIAAYTGATDNVATLYISDGNSDRILVVPPPQYTPTFIGSGAYSSVDGNNLTASFSDPENLSFDAAGNLYIVDDAVLIRKYSTSGLVTTIAGNLSTDGIDNTNLGIKNGIGTNATFGEIDCFTADKKGNIYATDADASSVIRKIVVTGYSISPALPAGLTFDATTGTISGTPTAASPASYYTVTAYNTSGSSSYVLGIKVVPPLTFGSLPAQVYGTADFSPGAVAVSGTITYTSSNSAVATIVNGNIHLTGAGTTTITAKNGTTTLTQQLTVTKATLTVTANNTYSVQGVPLPALTASYTGFINNDTQAGFSAQPSLTTTATSASGMGNYPITVSGGSSAKYNFKYVNGTFIMVNSAYLQTPIAVNYGSADFAALTVLTTGVTYSSSNTGVATVVASTGLVHLTGVGSTVITISSQYGTLTRTINVSKGMLTVIANNQYGATGAPLPALTITYQGFAKGDTVSKLSSLPVASTAATSSSTGSVYPITVSGGSSNYYNFTYVPGTFYLSPLANARAPISKNYGDADFPLLTITTTGGVSYSSSNTGVATITSNGTVHITGAGTTTFTLSSSAGQLTKTLTVAPANLNIIANSLTKVAGTGNPILTVSYSGFVYNQTPSVLTTQPTVSTSANSTSGAGNYAISVNGAAAPNYNITYTAGTLTVTAVKTGAPVISYKTPQTYTENTTITTLAPSSTGGTVPLNYYGNTTLFAGVVGATGNLNGAVSVATFNDIAGITFDKAGNVYVGDLLNNNIRKISTTGIVTTFAGSGAPGSANGTGTAASFNNYMGGLASDTSGNIYVADANNGLVRKISPAGVVSNFAQLNYPQAVATDNAGNVYVVTYGDNSLYKFTPSGTATFIANGFYSPFGVAVNGAGTEIVVSDFSNRIFKVTPTGVVTVLAGNTQPGNGNGTGASASFNNPNGLSIDAQGNVYVEDTNNNLIRMISPSGVVTTLAGSGANSPKNGIGTKAGITVPFYSAIDPQGKYLYVTAGNVVQKISLTGYNISPNLPQGLKLDSAGVISGTPLYASSATTYKVSAYNTSGSASATVNITVNGNDHKTLPPQITYPGAESYTVNTQITNVTPANTGGAVPATQYAQVTTLAGNGTQGNTNGTGSQATFTSPLTVATDKAGNVYVADFTSAVRKITPAGVVTNYTGTVANEGFFVSSMVADTSSNLYIADAANNRILKVTPSGVLTTFAGSGTAGYADGNGQFASFNYPSGLAMDNSGNIFVADLNNNMIRKISPAGIVTTYAGNGASGYVDGTASYAQFSGPVNVGVDNAGNVYVCDRNNKRIRKITKSGIVSTLAGNGNQALVDGTGIYASFVNPSFMTVDQAGFVYVSDYSYNVIRKVSPAGVVNTLAGAAGTASLVNGIGTAARFNAPQGLATDSLGNLYVADINNNVIRKVVLTGYTIDRSLPPGLSFNTFNGVISGTPTVDSLATNYSITGYNAVGNSSATISIAIVAAPGTNSIVKTNALVDEPVVNSALSPNGDGVNDVLTIKNIEKYPTNKFIVVNATGAKVYEATNYDNVSKSFDGHASTTGKLQLPGTYFYQLQYTANGASKVQTGYIVIKY